MVEMLRTKLRTKLSCLICSVVFSSILLLGQAVVAQAGDVRLEITNKSSHELVFLNDFFKTGDWNHQPDQVLAAYGAPLERRSTAVVLHFRPYTLLPVFFQFKYRARCDSQSWVEVRQGTYGQLSSGVRSSGTLTATIQDIGWVNDVVVRREVLIKDAP